MNLKRILIAGEGGQGIQSLSKILVATAFAENKNVVFLPNFGIEQRGGVSLGFIQISDAAISFPKFQEADIVVVFGERALARIESYLTPKTVLLFDNSLIPEKSAAHLKVERVAIPASYIAREKLVPKVFNMIMLGALFEELGEFSWKTAEKEIEKEFADKIKKQPQLKHFNLKAFEIGEETARGIK